MLRSIHLINAAVRLTGVLALVSAIGATQAKSEEYRFVVGASTLTGRTGELTVPVRATWPGLSAAIRVCVSGGASDLEDVMWQPQTGAEASTVGFHADQASPGDCVVTDVLDFAPTLAGTDAVLTARLSGGESLVFSVPVGAQSPYSTAETFMSASAQAQGSVTVVLPAAPVTTRTRTAVVCAAGQATLTQARLWMPAHGHGSSPTTITPRADGCFQVERLNFVMTGEWELQTTWSGGAAGAVRFNVVRGL